MSKRIIIFSTAYYPFVGGAEIAIKEITDRLGANQSLLPWEGVGGRFEFDLITARMSRKLPPRERIGNVTVHRMGVGAPLLDKLLLPILGLLKLLEVEPPRGGSTSGKIYWAVMVTYASFIPYFANLFRSKKTPIVLTLQEGDPIEGRRFGLLPVVWRWMLARADFVTAISAYLLDLARRYGYQGRAEVIPNGVDAEKFKPSDFPNFKQIVRSSILQKAETDIILITASRLVEKNAVGDIIESLKYLPDNVRFLIAGSGPLEEELKLEARSQKLEARVQFLGHIDHSELPKYLHAADIFVRPSLSEGLGNSFLEAMVAGIPVIATPVGGIPDFITNGVTGFYCEPKNPKSIAEAVQKIIANPNQTRQVVENAQKMVEEKYKWEKIARQMREVFEKIN